MLRFLKPAAIFCVALFVLSMVGQRGEPQVRSERNDQFLRYRAVEAYEIRPGVLMMPRYSANGQVCEIGLEKLHYSPERIRADSSLSRREVSEIFDELVPSDERGPRPQEPLQKGMTTFAGQGMVSDDEYQDVSIRIYSVISPTSKAAYREDEVPADTLTWKNRKCE